MNILESLVKIVMTSVFYCLPFKKGRLNENNDVSFITDINFNSLSMFVSFSKILMAVISERYLVSS